MASDDTSFGLALRFTVDVGNTSLGTWSKCEGIEMHFDTMKYQEGGAPGATWNYTHYATGRANYVPIKLTRAVTPQASTALLKWLSQQASSPAAPQPATIRCSSGPSRTCSRRSTAGRASTRATPRSRWRSSSSPTRDSCDARATP
jgi:hypothetical protein